MSLFGFAERQTDRNFTRHRAEHISSRRQHPVTADSPEGTSFSRMSPEVSCGGEIEVFPARLIVGRRRVPGPGPAHWCCCAYDKLP
jgi:hypothetical protein